MPQKLRSLDLFTGIGGTHLALETITKPIAYCEIDEHCVEIIKRRLPQAPIFSDVRKLTGKELLAHVPKDAKPQLITASFPCQDISSAGRGDGIGSGTRSGLVFDVFRLIGEIGPSVKLVFLENSPMIKTRGLDKIVQRCRKCGLNRIAWTYSTARDVGAHHVRRRWFLMAARDGTTKIPTTNAWDNFKFIDEKVMRLIRRKIDPSPDRKRISSLGNAVVPCALAHAWNTLADALNSAPGKMYINEVSTPQARLNTLELVFSNGDNRNNWITPVHHSSHWYPQVHFIGRCSTMLATQVFHERGTQKRFHFDDVLTARDTWSLNPEWVEALMGFPKGWTDITKADDTSGKQNSVTRRLMTSRMTTM